MKILGVRLARCGIAGTEGGRRESKAAPVHGGGKKDPRDPCGWVPNLSLPLEFCILLET